MILVVGQNTAWQKVCLLPTLTVGEVNRVERILEYASSKGPNVARTLRCMGQASLVLGYAGGRTGALLANDLAAEGIQTHLTPIRAETRICTTYAARDGRSTEVIEPSPEISPAERKMFQEIFDRHAAKAGLLFICGTAVRGESADCYSRMVGEARGRGTVVLMDSACPESVNALARSPEIFKVNASELSLISSSPADTPARRLEIYSMLASRHGIKWFFTTLGSGGMEGWNGRELLHAVPPEIHVVNAIGSGDAASAGIGWTLLQSAGSGPIAAALDSPDVFRQALLNGAAMGTANCLNPKNGWVEPADFSAIQKKTVVREIRA